MSNDMILSSKANNLKTMIIQHMLTMQDCTCTSGVRDPACAKYTVEVDYEPLCIALGFDSSKKLFIADTNENIQVEDPVAEDQRKPFDPHVRVVRIPMHKCTQTRLILKQTE
jgi:hypothetical protein